MNFKLNPVEDKWLPDNKLGPISFAKPISSPTTDAREYRVVLQKIEHDFHPKLSCIPMWSYGSSSPGEFIEAEVGHPVRVTWFNNLVQQNLETILEFGDLQGMEEVHMYKVTHNAVHLHGARVPWTSDGVPDHVFHPHEGRIYYYPNSQPAAMLWYHDHAMDVTRLNVYAGLFGAYLLRDPLEASVLPSGRLEIPLILQDKSFSEDGKKLFYEQKVDKSNPSPEATPEFVGDYPVVNGKIWPLLELEPRIYRFRLLNGANTRFFNLSLVSESLPRLSLTFYVIGTDGGFLENPVPVTELLLAPGERADVLLDFRTNNCASFILTNNAAIPYSDDPSSVLSSDDPCAQLLKIVVNGDSNENDARFDPASITLPARIDPVTGQVPRSAFPAIEAALDMVPIELLQAYIVADGIPLKLRRIKLEEYQLFMNTLPGMRVPTVQVNGQSYMTAPMHEDPTAPCATVDTTKDAIEVWEFVNVTPDTHPMHLHLVQFQVMSRLPLVVNDDPARISDDLPEPKLAAGYVKNENGERVDAPVQDYEKGWKDTVRCNPSQSTRVLVRFDGSSGNYVYHCHILEHEDMGMMCRLNVDA